MKTIKKQVIITIDEGLMGRLAAALKWYPYLSRNAFIVTAILAYLEKIEKKHAKGGENEEF